MMTRAKKSRRHNAFTLIELVVSLVLGAILMAAMLGVMRRSFDELRIVSDDAPLSLVKNQLIEQLRRDLTNARRLQVGNNRFELAGFVERDSSTWNATHRAARVRYEIQQRGRVSALVRIQSSELQSNLVQSRELVELVYINAGQLALSSNEIGAISEVDTIGLGDSGNLELIERRLALPTMIRVVLTDDRGRKVIDYTFSRHRESE